MNTSVEVWFVDDKGHTTGCIQWAPTPMSPSDKVYWQSESVDVSNPDEGITVMGGLLSLDREDIGSRYDVTEERSLIVSAEELARAGEVYLNGRLVLVRAAEGERADFDCGLMWATDSDGGGEEPETDAPQAAGAPSGDDADMTIPVKGAGSPEDGRAEGTAGESAEPTEEDGPCDDESDATQGSEPTDGQQGDFPFA